MKAADVWNWDFPKKTVRCNYPAEQMSSGGEGRLSWMPLKVLLCDDLQTVIEPELLPIEVLHCGNRNFAFFGEKIVEIINFLSAPQKGRNCRGITSFEP